MDIELGNMSTEICCIFFQHSTSGSVIAFDNEQAALEWAEHNRFDTALLDIRLRDARDPSLAEKLRDLAPYARIVFSDYPINPQRNAAPQEKASAESTPRKLIQVRCFGSFEVFSNGTPLHFKRSKTKEFFAYLIDRRGAAVSSRELCAQLWEDKTADKGTLNYLHQLAADLRRTLAGLGAEEVLIALPQGYSLNTERIDCDYYRLLDGDPAAIRSFSGEYMNNYSWSEYTCAYLMEKNERPD